MMKAKIKKLEVSFVQHDYPGWIGILLKVDKKKIAFGKKEEISASEVYSPFWNLIRFLENIISGNLPNSFVIDEEGIEKKFEAKPYKNNDDLFLFITSEVVYSKKEKSKVYLEGIFDKKQFVKEWFGKFKNFISSEYNRKLWIMGHQESDLKRINTNKLKTFLKK